ncbi:MAG: UvrD-helicase domain-containing protein [Tannerellaceae bacterium]|jgi:ATP-dependent exoDNAse (exonuclease V) beta subunit|nr:UvrD-helicase domain-containing protein [Tannerellaceae bacterium]
MLTIYRASAGAGKTHRLTGEYLKLLFAGEQAYRRILAVTFTNKATDEMKSRIIEELHRLAAGQPSAYVGILREKYPLGEEQIRSKARAILIAILHDYAAFNISTIDRFFQQIMRAFTREIGLQGGYNIELDQDMALNEAIDNLLSGLDRPESKDLLGWLLRFAGDRIESGGEWNLRREITTLSREIFKERYKTFSHQVSRDIDDKQSLDAFQNECYALIRSTEKQLKDLGQEALRIIHQFGLQPSDFKQGSRSPFFYFERLAKGEIKEPPATLTACTGNLAACYAKTAPPATIQLIGCAFNNGLDNCLQRLAELFDHPMIAYYSAREAVRNFYTLGILNDVSRQVDAYRKEKNIMLIADTTELLNRIIDGSDTPFIYEKTGAHIHHYMIDEFQDTSDMQWNNFRPLIAESLAHRYDNLIVGDVKQSIYRFRNSNWKLLDRQIAQDFFNEQLTEETLTENWRSHPQVVAFNNALFSAAPALLNDPAIIDAYAGSRQHVPPPLRDKEGHVCIDFLRDDDDTGTDWKDEALQRLSSTLEHLQDQGYALQDIAILVRTNQEGARVADTLLACKERSPDGRYRYDMISDDALFVSRSPVVRFIIALLRHLKNPARPTPRRMACLAYLALVNRFDQAGEMTDFPPSIRSALQDLSHQALYEMTEGIFRLFSDHIPDKEQVFAQAFFDMVLDFSHRENASLDRFLTWWDETGSRKTIATPDGQDAIRILTIHKSKGLGFKAVILPFCEWSLDHKSTHPVTLWCHPTTPPFDRIYLLPIRYGQSLTRTIFAEDYREEHLNASIDSLNTLYVAFTRAKEELIAFAPRPSKVNEATGATEKISSVADLLWTSLASLRDVFPFDTGAGTFELGSSRPPAARKTEACETEEIPMGRLCSISPAERLRLSLNGKGFSLDDASRKHGILMHDILCGIRTREDIPASVETFRTDGVIDGQEAESLVAHLEELLSHPGVAQWYDGSARVLNEVEILSGKGLVKRPDRVMIYPDRVVVVDYKSGKPSPRHLTQVGDYLSLIRRMNYACVEGYLWYITSGQILPCV